MEEPPGMYINVSSCTCVVYIMYLCSYKYLHIMYPFLIKADFVFRIMNNVRGHCFIFNNKRYIVVIKKVISTLPIYTIRYNNNINNCVVRIDPFIGSGLHRVSTELRSLQLHYVPD